ncbi:MAG: glycosyltransferase, partial [Candidatus Brocadiaceae bacterium]
LPVVHGGTFLQRAVASAQQLDYRADRYEVIVAGPPGDDGSRRVVEDALAGAGCEIRYVQSAAPGRAAQLNAACATARGRMLAFSDDDCTFPRDWLSELKQAVVANAEAAVIGGTDRPSGEAVFDVALDWVLDSFAGSGGGRDARRHGVTKYYPRLWNMALSRSMASMLGAQRGGNPPAVFDETLQVHEDVDVVQRAEALGGVVRFAPDVCVVHARDTTFWGAVSRNFLMARAARTLGVHRLAQSFLSLALIVALGLGAAALFVPPLRVAALALFGLYLMYLMANGVLAFREKRVPSMFVAVPVLLAALHAARAAGYLFPMHVEPRRR